MWEIFVPTEKRVKSPRPSIGGGGDYHLAFEAWEKANTYRARYHRVWDAKVREITGGLSIFPPIKGQWVSQDGELFAERMIPVRIVATREEIEKIIEFTLEYYDQLAVLCYRVSDEVIIKHRSTK